MWYKNVTIELGKRKRKQIFESEYQLQGRTKSIYIAENIRLKWLQGRPIYAGPCNITFT